VSEDLGPVSWRVRVIAALLTVNLVEVQPVP
jgi:hypothetical protein